MEDMNGENNYRDDDGTQASPKLIFETGVDFNAFTDSESNEEKLSETTQGNENIELIHSNMQKKLIPVIGMEFETEEEAFKFYNAYAYGVGFSIRRSKFHKEKCGKLRDRLFVCSAEGKREKNKLDGSVKSHRAETRFGCLARMKISCRLNDKYCVTEFMPEHTHVTFSPCKTHFFRSHRNMSLAQIVEADMADSSGIAPKATLELLSRQAGGRQNLGFIPVDYKNYLRSKRTREMRVGDTGGLLEYLQQMQLSDPNFFYAIQVDEDDMITNIFWVDARMMVDYDYFGDVVCFDTTYRKNKDGRPFAMFVGVNNHRQNVVFSAALLYAETSDTFIWLFDTFVKAMSGKKPISILTDQDAAKPEVFKLFQDELCKAHDCVLKFNGEIGSISKYEVIPHKKYWHHTVTFDSIDNTVLCSCKKYEFAGILCAHALKVLSTRNIKSIPAQYILKRWTKNIKAKSAKATGNVSSENDSKVEIVKRYRELCRFHTQLATRASESKDAYEIAILGLNNTLGDVDACLKKKASQEPTQEPDSHNETIHMPTQSQATMDISQQYYIRTHNTLSNYQQGPTSMMNLLQAELPQEEELSLLSYEGLDLLSSELTCSAKTHDMDIQDVE